VEALADELGLAGGFERDEDLVAHGEELLPVFFERGDVAGNDLIDVGEERKVDAGLAVLYYRQRLPDLVGGEAEDGGDEAGEGLGDAPERSLRGAACGMVACKGVETVLEDVEIERAEVGVGVLVERVVGAVELEVVV